MLFSQIKTWFIFNNFVIWWLAKQHFKSQNVSKNVFSVCYVVFFVCFFLSKNVSLHFELIVDVETYMHLLIEDDWQDATTYKSHRKQIIVYMTTY